MLFFYLTENDKVTEVDAITPGCWINMVAPSNSEIQSVCDELGIDADFIRAALDEEERSRLEVENGNTLILVDTPIVEVDGSTFAYTTLPLGIVMTDAHIVTVCLNELPLLEDFFKNRVRGFSTKKMNRFILQALYKNATRFLTYLRQIDKASIRVEGELHKSMRNKELIQMLNLEKSLVFFSTSLKGNEIVLERLSRTDPVRKYPDDLDLLDDVIVENKQAIEMCTIYRDILSGTMDAFASVISNNLNIVMKLLTAITIMLAVPTLFASLWGMNVKGLPFANSPFGFWIVTGIAVVGAGVAALWMFRKKIM